MKTVRLFSISFLVCATLSTFAIAQSSSEIRSPESVFGFVPGSDRELIDYEQLVDYLLDLAAASDRIQMREVGTSPLGRTMYVAFISAPENLARLDELRVGVVERRRELHGAVFEPARPLLVGHRVERADLLDQRLAQHRHHGLGTLEGNGV